MELEDEEEEKKEQQPQEENKSPQNIRLNQLILQMQKVQEETKKELQRAPEINKVPKVTFKLIPCNPDIEETKAEPQQAQ